MSLNLIDAARGLFSNDLLSRASAYLGENESSVNKAIAGIVPGVLGGIADKAGSNEGTNIVFSLAQEQYNNGTLDNLDNFFGNESGSLLNKGAGLITNLFGDHKLDTLTHLIAGYADAKTTSVASLLSMATPALLAFLGKHAVENNLNASGLAAMLISKKDSFKAALPAGLDLGTAFGSFAGQVAPSVPPLTVASGHTSDHQQEETPTGGSALNWLLPLLLLALIAAAALYFSKGCNQNAGASMHGGQDSAKHDEHDGHDHGASSQTTVVGKVDSLGNFVYETGEATTITLPNNGGELKVGKNSTEAKLIAFLNDKNAAIDTAKGNWFELTNVRFKKGSADLLDESTEQLKNLVAISKAYPSAVFKFGGYTDNTGTAATNIALSQKRADAVMAMVKKLGAAPTALAGAKGYGPDLPICAANDTPECQAQNRRVAVNVKAK